MEEATSENVLAGIAMGRRAGYMYGMRAAARAARPRRHRPRQGARRAAALGIAGADRDSSTARRRSSRSTACASSSSTRRLPRRRPRSPSTCRSSKAFCGAEIVSHTLHNLYTLRGAKVRDALKWSGYIDEAIAAVRRRRGRLRQPPLAACGATRASRDLPGAAARHLPLHPRPDAAPGQRRARRRRRSPRSSSCRHRCARVFANRGYYGTVRHNAKAVYQVYFGWYDGNPAQPRTRCRRPRRRRATSRPWAAPPRCCAKAQAAFDKGDYRWAATLLTTSSSPTRTTRRRASCWRAPTTSSATRRSRGRGATST